MNAGTSNAKIKVKTQQRKYWEMNLKEILDKFKNRLMSKIINT